MTDQANILGPETRRRLTEALTAHENATGNQIAVLTIPTLAGEPVERYANRVRHLEAGTKGKDDGVLVVVAPRDHKMRIEVGYGLEPLLTDATTNRIMREHMAPRFKAGDYPGGISAASPRSSRGWAAARLISKRTMSGPWRRPTRQPPPNGRQIRRRFP